MNMSQEGRNNNMNNNNNNNSDDALTFHRTDRKLLQTQNTEACFLNILGTS